MMSTASSTLCLRLSSLASSSSNCKDTGYFKWINTELSFSVSHRSSCVTVQLASTMYTVGNIVPMADGIARQV